MKKCVKTAINAVLSTALVMLIIGCWTLVGVKASDDTTYTFSDYRENNDKDAEGNWIDVPKKEGHVFAGWYDADGNAAPKNVTTGDYKAKFVKEDVLGLKLQLKSSNSTEPVTSETSEADLRLITSVDTLNYSSVGFTVIGPKATKTYISNTVYQTIKGYTYTDDNQIEQTYTPKVFCEDSNYFMSHIVQGADNTADSHDATDQFGTTLKVVPQWTTLDGTLVYGVERAFEINDGIEEYVAEIDEVNGSGEKGDHVWYTTLGDAVTDANRSAKTDAVTIGLLRDFSLNARVVTTRNINIQNVTSEDITISRGDNVTDYTMIRHEPSAAGTLIIGTNEAGVASIIFDGEDLTEHEQVAINNRANGTMYLNKNVTVKNMKVNMFDAANESHGAGGFNNMGTAYVSATFTNCTGYNGGAIYSIGTAIDFNGTIQDCQAYEGAGIYTTNALDMTGGSITRCESSSNGGGIRVGGTTIINISAGNITACSAAKGGGIYGAGNAIVNVSAGNITECSAVEEGGAIYGAEVNFTGGEISTCEAARGAGIRAYKGVVDGNITDCDSTGADQTTSLGGGVYAAAGKVTVNKANIKDCDAYFGGGIYVVETATLELKGGIIDNCDSLGTDTGSSRGGGVYTLGTVNITAGEIKNSNAARGAGIMVDSATGILNMSGGSITNCISLFEGGGIYGSGSGTVNFNGGTISSCSAANGGAIQLVKGTVKGKITDCNATSIGGGVVINGTIEMKGATIVGCSAPSGGGVYERAGSFTMTSGTIEGCSATSNGGGVYVEAGTFILGNGAITDCSANQGGGVYEKAGTFTMSGDDATIENITGCTADTYGGGVHVNNGTFELESGIITGCTATTGGGGIFANNGTSTVSGGTIAKCTSKTGGGVFVNGATFTMSNGNINECEATGTVTDTGTGGGIHGVTGGTINFAGGKIYKCTAATNGGGIRIIRGQISGGIIDSCTAAGYGGGVLFDGANTAVIPTMTAGTIQNCSAKYGGGVGMSFNAAAKEMTMSGGTIAGCSATTGGGGIAFDLKEPSTLTMTSVTIQNCVSEKQGGGIYEGKGTSTLNLEGATIYNCDSTADNSTDGRGGGVYSFSSVNMTAGTIENCNAQRGSGIYMGAATGVLTMSSGNITNCDSVENGGGIYGEGSSYIYFNGGTIESCQALVGGGIRLANGTVGGTIKDCHAVDNNTADTTYPHYGGGVYAANAITMTGTLENCTAYRGAGIWSNATLTMSSGNIINCDSNEHGAGIYGTGAAIINFNGGTITSCDSEIGSGGGIRLTSGTIKGTISNCTAKNGGAVFMDGTTPSVTVAGGTLSGCTATSQGGGVFVNKAGTLTMSSGSITGCTGTVRGGGLYLESTADFTMTGGSLTSNTSGAWGGAIFAAQDNIVTLTAGTISGNTSTHADIYGTNNAIQATQCGTTTQVALGSEFDMGANSIHFTGVTERTTPVLKITGTSLTNHSATNPLYIAMSDDQPGLVQIQCDSNAAATNICAALKSADSKAMFSVNGSIIETKNIAISSMTFNVLGSGKEGDGTNGTYLSPSVRAPHVYSYLESSGMDLIGIQEAQEGTYDWQAGFKNNLSSTYGMIRITDQSNSPSTIGIANGLIILYNTDRFTLVSSGLQQYSSDSGRYFQWAKFTDNYTKKTVYMTNTHWTVLKNSDGTTNSTDSSSARVTQANELLSFWKNTVGSNILIATGDYNSLPTLTEFTTLSGGIYKSTDTVLGDIKTDRIDHIFINPNLTHAHAYQNGTLKFTHTDGAEYMMSDHAPRIATILIR